MDNIDNNPAPRRHRRTNKEILAAGGLSKAAQRKSENNRYRYDIEARIRYLISTYKSQDKKHGRGLCDLDSKEMLERVMKGVCEATGAILDFSPVGGGGQRKKRAFSFSFDRIDNEKPHSKDNVRVVCSIYNIMRGNYSADEVDRFIEILREPIRAENMQLRQSLLAILTKCAQAEGGADLVLQECRELAQKALYQGAE